MRASWVLPGCQGASRKLKIHCLASHAGFIYYAYHNLVVSDGIASVNLGGRQADLKGSGLEGGSPTGKTHVLLFRVVGLISG